MLPPYERCTTEIENAWAMVSLLLKEGRKLGSTTSDLRLLCTATREMLIAIQAPRINLNLQQGFLPRSEYSTVKYARVILPNGIHPSRNKIPELNSLPNGGSSVIRNQGSTPK
ncbi:hypothetical protein JTB14_000350 [Gonioctena quinquepunctata]|nr:hypothetical protein JTB14_000350 [Gonioctena quinquepunctata]